MHKRVCVVGCGYVGLTTGLYLSDQYATSVVFVEKDPHSLSSLGAGTLPIAEPGLSEIFKKNRSNLTFHSSIPSDQLPFDAIYVCVGTPSTVEGISLDQMCSAAADIQSFLQISSSKEIMVVIRSTIVPGSTREIFEKLETDLTSDHSVKVIYNPEFLREGSALKDIRGEGRNLYGTNKGDRCLTFENLLKNPIATTWETAEFSKYYSNIFYVSLMAYSNEMAFIAESLPYEIDMKTVVKQHILDKRITKAASGGSNDLETTGFETYLPPSFGYGGSCFPKDTLAFQKFLQNKFDHNSALLSAFMLGNTVHLDERLMPVIGLAKQLEITKPSLLGLTFKPNTDDIRNSPALVYLRRLAEEFNKLNIFIHDPMKASIEHALHSEWPKMRIQWMALEEILISTDFLSITTSWDLYKEVDYSCYPNIKIILDAKGILDNQQIKDIKKAGKFYIAPGTNIKRLPYE